MITSADSIIMTEVAKVAMSPSASISDFFKAIIPKLPAIALMVVVKKCIDNAGDFLIDVWNLLSKTTKSIIYTVFYKEIIIDKIDDHHHVNYYINEIYENKKSIYNTFWFPIYTNTADSLYSISYISWYNKHKQIMKDIHMDADMKLKQYTAIGKKDVTLYKKYEKNDYVNYAFSSLYPSRNFLNLQQIITTHCSVSRLINSYSVLGILVDSTPGLGKTKFCDYAAEHKIVNYVYKVDMTTVLDIPFKIIIQQIYHKIAIIGHTLFMIDELDKYIDYRIKVEYHSHKVSNKEFSQSVEEFTQHEKLNYLYEMLAILERDGLSHSVIVIFCANNFHSIFDGIDIIHHVSLYDRFTKVPFHHCNYDDVIGYIDYYNQKLQNSIYYDDKDIHQLKKLLRKDIIITQRSLHKIAIQSKYKASDIINMLNNYDNEENSGKNLANNIITSKTPNDIINNAKNDNVPSILYDAKNDNVSTIIKNDNVSSKINDIIPTNIDNTIIDQKIKDVDESDFDNIAEYISDKLEDCNEKEFYEYITFLDKNTYIVNDQYKMERHNINKHQYIWIKDFCCRSMYLAPDSPLKNEIIKTVKNYLDSIDGAPYDKQLQFIVELFDYLAIDGYSMCVRFNAFITAVVGKIHLINISMYQQLQPETRKFLYALVNLDETHVNTLCPIEYDMYVMKCCKKYLNDSC